MSKITKKQQVLNHLIKYPTAQPRAVSEKFGMAMPAVYSLRKQAMKEFQERNAAEMLRVQMNQETATHIPQPVVEKQFAPSPKANDLQYGGDHYKNMGVEPWDVVDTWPIEQRIGYYRGGALKYIMRMGSKVSRPSRLPRASTTCRNFLRYLEVWNERQAPVGYPGHRQADHVHGPCIQPGRAEQ